MIFVKCVSLGLQLPLGNSGLSEGLYSGIFLVYSMCLFSAEAQNKITPVTVLSLVLVHGIANPSACE